MSIGKVSQIAECAALPVASRWECLNLPSLHQFILHVAALEEPSRLQALKLCRFLHAEDFTENT